MDISQSTIVQVPREFLSFYFLRNSLLPPLLYPMLALSPALFPVRGTTILDLYCSFVLG